MEPIRTDPDHASPVAISLDALFRLHATMPQAGPGSDVSTRRAIAGLPPLPASPQILDIGCGPGRQTIVLARHFRSRVTAVDIHQPFLDHLTENARREGIGDLIETRNASMDTLDQTPASIDLIWCEGAAYIIGVPNALSLWRPLLSTGGAVAFTELTWLTDDRPGEAVDYWAAAYPAMTTITGMTEIIRSAGYEAVAHQILPPNDWLEAYYRPLRRRIADLRRPGPDDPEMAAVLDDTEREISLYERYGESFGYVFHIIRKPD